MTTPEGSHGSRWRGLAMVAAVLGLGLSGIWAAANGQSAAPGWWPGISRFDLSNGPCKNPKTGQAEQTGLDLTREVSCGWNHYDTALKPYSGAETYLSAWISIAPDKPVKVVITAKARKQVGNQNPGRYAFEGEAWNEQSCVGAAAILQDIVDNSGLPIKVDLTQVQCEEYEGVKGGVSASLFGAATHVRDIEITAPLKAAAPARTPAAAKSCDPSQLAGKWTNAGKEYAGWGVSLTVTAANGGARGEFGRTKRRAVTDNRIDWPVPMLKSFSIGGAPVTPTADGKCRFRASGYSGNDGSSFPWSGTITYDSRRDALSVEGQESTAWTRGGPPPVVAQICKRADIEGAWYRTDGTALRISATNLDSGGVGLFFVHPRGWPRGVVKYSAIRQTGDSCSYEAVCVEIKRDAGSGDYTILEPACILTLDPVKGVLSQGGRWSYSRTASLTPEAEARRQSEAELQAQDRASEALNAEITRRNAEAAARDQAKKDEFARRQREYEAKKRADEAAYARAQAEYERKKAEVEAQRQRELREWEARVAACKAGEKTQCAPS